MALKAVLFDLDGTLLPMDQEVFVQGYFKLLAEKAASRGYEPEKLYRGIWAAIKAVVHNDGAKRNEEVFWRAFAGIFGPQVMADKPMFDAFYLNGLLWLYGRRGQNNPAGQSYGAAGHSGNQSALSGSCDP